MISYLIKNKKAKKGAYMRKCEGIYSLIGKVNHKSAIYGFELLKEKNLHPRQMPLIIHLRCVEETGFRKSPVTLCTFSKESRKN